MRLVYASRAALDANKFTQGIASRTTTVESIHSRPFRTLGAWLPSYAHCDPSMVSMPARATTDIDALRTDVCAAVAAFDARQFDRGGAINALRQWTAIAHAAQTAASLAAARIAECGPPPSAGARDASEYIAKETGTTAAKAKERIETGALLQGHDKTRQQATAGQLSPDQAAAITDAVAADPTAEDTLLASGGDLSLRELRDRCADTKAAVTDLAEQERRVHANRSIRRYRDRDGAEHLHAIGTKRDLALIDQALKPYVEQRFQQARTDGVREPYEAYLFDGMIDLARDSLDGGTAPGPRRKDPIRHLGLLRIDLEALVRGRPVSDETCEIAGLGPISVDTARELLGESILKLVITKGVDVINVTHLGRGPNTAQKIALLWQLAECSRLGCPRRARLEDDHTYGYEYHKTKHTRLDETEPLCDPDHDLKTYKGWALVEGTGKRLMVPPDDPRHPNNTRPPP